jgi:hypothetical protein
MTRYLLSRCSFMMHLASLNHHSFWLPPPIFLNCDPSSSDSYYL